ncbi:golgin subfamily B member 1 [Brachionichthys hirsutus]|uniref:golgin subfamily B member 1 n=1 Tax=Brachionichthys hirsutus TaxID=412623 RepID=UPI003604F6F6
MLSRLATVLQDLSGEEGTDGDPQDMLAPQLPVAEGRATGESEAPEEAVERLAHVEQLVVQLKELVREKDTQLNEKDAELANRDVQFKNEKEEFEARFTKLKLQAKAKMVSLNRQITDLKGQGGATPSPDSSFSVVGLTVEEELQELKNKLSEEETNSRALQEQLQTAELLLQGKESAHSEQLLKLQAVVCEKDVRFQEQIQKHEEELLRVATQSQNDNEFQQALHAAQRRCEELEEALNSRSQVLEMLQQEVSSADQQKQILTAQFREMEKELADAVGQREEESQRWAEHASRTDAELEALRTCVERQNVELARQESELDSSSKAEFESREALEKEKVEVARLERELSLVKDSELAAVQASHETSERDKAEVARLGRELACMREAAGRPNRDASEGDKAEVARLGRELACMREAHGDAQKKGEILAEIWTHLRGLAREDVQSAEELAVPVDLSLYLDAVRAVQMQLARLRDERGEREEHCAKLAHTIEILHEQIDGKNAEQEETAAKIQELEQQILTLSESDRVTEPASESSEDQKAYLQELEQQLLEKDNELRLATEHSPGGAASSEDYQQSPDQGPDASPPTRDSSAAPHDLIEDAQEEDTTLVAEETSIMSLSADIERNSELTEQHSESPEECKGTPSDEMVTSSDSEVAHSSWTLLEAVNQDGGQDWPPILQDFSQMQLQSWEATSMESESSAVQAASSSVGVRETVQVHLTPRRSPTPDQAFAQTLAEELQGRYGDLSAELQKLREAAAESQGKIKTLEEDVRSLSAAKQEAESQASAAAEELQSAREELVVLSQQSGFLVEKHGVEFQLLEEQMEILNTESKSKEETIQVLLADLQMAQQAVSEQEGLARMLSVQLEDRELVSSQFERRIQDMEYSMLESSQASELDAETLSRKDSEISDLQLRLSQKEDEVKGLNDGVTAKLLRAEEQKLQMGGEVDRLKEQILELERVRDERRKDGVEDSTDRGDDEQNQKEMLETQLANTKKRLQAALVQRKELLKKVADYEAEAGKWKAQAETATGGTLTNILEVEQSGRDVIEEMETKLCKLAQALRSKEEEGETLERKIIQQDQALAELAANKKRSEEADISAETASLQSQLSSLEAECETLQKKVQEVQESRKDTIRKAKEKDRHHREQLKQQKDEYGDLMERFQAQSGDCEALQAKLLELEEHLSKEGEGEAHQKAEQQAAGAAVPEDWVDFTTSEVDSSHSQAPGAVQLPAEPSEGLSIEVESLKALRAEMESLQMNNSELEKLLQETQATLSLKEAELLGKEEKERQIDVLSKEMNELREQHHQAEAYAKGLKAEMEAAEKAQSEENASSMANLRAEVEDFKRFLDDKNLEIMELGQQLSEQSSFIQSMQETVSQKDQLIYSLQDSLKAEQEKTQRLEVEVPLKQEDEKESEAKIQQLQRKLQAALISRKEALRESKSQKEQITSTAKIMEELQQEIESVKDELKTLKAENVKLIDEVDRTLLENQSLGSSCESLKLAMEGILNEKDAYKSEAELAKGEATRTGREWEEKLRGMKEEYETLLKSYENVSDEAERVRRVLEAARQERQELASRARTHEAVRQEAEKQTEEARKEVESVKDKMRKFAKTKQQKILDLEEENERLREMQEKAGVKPGDEALKAELDRLQDEVGPLRSELDAAVTERDSLRQQIEELRDRSTQTPASKENIVHTDPLGSAAAAEDAVAALQADVTTTRPEHVESRHENASEETLGGQRAPETRLKPADAEEERAEDGHSLWEDKMRLTETNVNAERELWHQAEAELKGRLSSLEQKLQESRANESHAASLEKLLQESKEREKRSVEEGSEKEAQLKELLRRLETEKDNLEERLMNQLAQLNGSIADYQQQAAELQREVERLERERAQLEAGAQHEGERAARLEEDMRQARRERAEAEAESGQRRELEQKLRSAQRVKEGSQSRARQLEELLTEKQLEVRQLQKDCIKYQERISELCRDAKALQLDHDELHKALGKSLLENSQAAEDLRRNEEELVRRKSELDEARKQVSEASAEKSTVERDAQKKEALIKAEAEQTLDSVRFRLGAELKEMELRLEDAYNEREKEEEETVEAREVAGRAETRAREANARLDESLARLAAFSRCMSSLQDDRDRVLDEAKQWESRFKEALRGKETEVREAETRAKELVEKLQRESTRKDELVLSVDRLEKADEDWQLKLEEEGKKLSESQAALEEEKSKLHQTAAELQASQNEARALKNEAESLRQRARALEEAVGRLQGEADRARTEQRAREAEERRLCLNVEQLAADLRSSKALTESLQTELHVKERREVEMLGEKEQAVAEAAEEARREADGRAQGAEEELEQRRSDLRQLEEKLRKTEEEGDNRKAKLDSFTRAMGSLQDDRDGVLNMYKQLEEKHLQVMLEKDALIQEAAGENNSLKEELRSLLVQRDDLHAEKAKLSAQLHGYRDDLNRVLSMKDSQHKKLLAAQQERISVLERERRQLEGQLEGVGKAREAETEAGRAEMETPSQAADLPAASAPGAEVEELREQLQAAREQAEALEETLLKEKQAHESKSKEFAGLRWEGGVMRTESESAQERVAELARDLLAVEQKLLQKTEETLRLRAENQSLSKAMASLQDNRDQAVEKAQELRLKLEEVTKAGGASSTGEVWGLKNALQALQNDRERLLEQLQGQTSELKKQRSELARLGAGELIKVSQELFEEKTRNKDMLEDIMRLENAAEMSKQEIETLRLERIDWMAQAEQLKHQTLATLSDRDQQLRQLAAMLEEARAHEPTLEEHYQREGTTKVDSPPGAPQERSRLQGGRPRPAEVKELQRRLDEETQQRVAAEEQLMATRERFKRQAKWHSEQDDQSETAVFIEPPEGSAARTQRGGPGLMRTLRALFCSRQRTLLLFSLYLLTVHVLLLLCLGGYL